MRGIEDDVPPIPVVENEIGWLILILDAGFFLASGVFIRTLDGPASVQRGDDLILNCKYDLEGGALYAVKWFRGNREFFRFEMGVGPKMARIFPLDQLHVDVSRVQFTFCSMARVLRLTRRVAISAPGQSINNAPTRPVCTLHSNRSVPSPDRLVERREAGHAAHGTDGVRYLRLRGDRREYVRDRFPTDQRDCPGQVTRLTKFS